MFQRFPVRSLRLAGLAALVAGLLWIGEGQSQEPGQKGKPKPGPKGPKADPAVKLKESEVLKEAYILMAMANANYKRHKARGMREVESAITILDKSILKNGTNGQKVVALEEEIIAARVKFLADNVHKIQGRAPESQAVSDLQLAQARQLLERVHAALDQHKQTKVRGHVDRAIGELTTALKVR